MRALILIALAYALCCWWDGREERQHRRRIERELADLERRDGDGPWL
jgi:hypothetical protein